MSNFLGSAKILPDHLFCHDKEQPSSNLKVWNSEPNVHCRTSIIQDYFQPSTEGTKKMNDDALSQEKDKHGSFFTKKIIRKRSKFIIKKSF